MPPCHWARRPVTNFANACRMQRPAWKMSITTRTAVVSRDPQPSRHASRSPANTPRHSSSRGATDLAVQSNLRFLRPRHLISLEAIEELRQFEDHENGVTLGASLPLTEIGERWTDPPRAVREWLPLFASPLLRNRATLGGSLATASPIGDSAPLLIAFSSVLHLAGSRGRRTVPVDSFFTGYRRTVLEPGELIAAVEIPKPLPALSAFYKVAKRRFDDISTVAFAVTLTLDAAGSVERFRLALGGVAAIPLHVMEAEEAVVGTTWNQAAVDRIQSVLERILDPISDHRGSARYRIEVAKSLVEKFWWETREAA